MTDQQKIELLRDIILGDDRKVIENLSENIEKINNLVDSKDELGLKVNSIIHDRIEEFQKSIPEKLGPQITAALQKQISESQAQVVDILYPIIGKMVGKYIRREFEKITERIDRQFRKAFSIDGWIRRFKGWISGSKESEMIIRDLVPPSLLEMFIIEKNSGILKAHYAVNKALDADLVAGMLTAIKSFVEDAFSSGEQQLEMIEYDNYKIVISSFNSFYIANVISGILNAEFRAKLDHMVLDFAQKYLASEMSLLNRENEPDITKQLKEFIDGTNI